jgi:hypothetical protein
MTTTTASTDKDNNDENNSQLSTTIATTVTNIDKRLLLATTKGWLLTFHITVNHKQATQHTAGNQKIKTKSTTTHS